MTPTLTQRIEAVAFALTVGSDREEAAETLRQIAAEVQYWRPVSDAAFSRDNLFGGRYFCDGPQGWFVGDDLRLLRDVVNAYDKDDDWTITDTSNPTGPTQDPQA